MLDIAVVMFGFNRPEALSRLIASFSLAPEARNLPVYIYLDGARTEPERTRTAQVASVAEAFEHPAKTVVSRPQNLGLKKSLRSGISEVLDRHDAVIVLEDDLVLGPNALAYFLAGLNRYQGETRVASICAYAMTDDNADASGGDGGVARFLPMTHPWGWATWRDRWQSHAAGFDQPVDPALLRSRSFRQAMNLSGLRNWTQMLGFAEKGIVGSWWIYWHLDAVQHHRVSLFPTRSLLRNAGLDGSGTHVSRWNILRWLHPTRSIDGAVNRMPEEITVDFHLIDRARMSRHARFDRMIGALGALRRRLKELVKR